MNTLTQAMQHWMNEMLRRADSSNDVKTKVDADGKYIRTPWELCFEILGNIKQSVTDLSNKKILVVDTVEFVPVLLAFGVNKCNIVFVAPYEFKGKIASSLGVTVVQESLLIWKTDMKFDVVVGNPPYNGDDGEQRDASGNTNNSNLYFEFIRKSLKITNVLSFVVPAGWMNDKIKKEIVEAGLCYVKLVPASNFPDVGIRSGITIINTVVGYNGKIKIDNGNTVWEYNRHGVLSFSNPIGHSICEKLKKNSTLGETGRNGNYIVNKGSKGSLERLISLNNTYSAISTTSHTTKVLIYSGGKRDPARYLYSTNSTNSSKYGVAIPHVSDKHIIGVPRLINPGEGVSDRNKVFFYNTIDEANNVISYLNSKIIRFVLTVKKFNDTVNTNLNSYNWIPLIDFTKSWSDDDLFAHFNITSDEITYIGATLSAK